ncbi:MAG TPA: GspH/FimT family pseudopilin [Pyrinomonadaceae bacterium]|nr:GspH/FimT family pseudopilin [Pyrinomonadaceae bacterium]
MKPQNRIRLKINSKAHAESGFTALQLVFTIAIIGIVSSFAVIQLTSARQQIRLQSVARTFASHVEKARLDAVRRHGGETSAPPTVQFASDLRSYSVTMDFAGTGTSSTRVVPLDADVRLVSDPPPPIVFNWRGRTALCTQTFTMESGSGQTTIDVSGSGDVTIDSDAGAVPVIAYTSVSNTNDIASEAVVIGATPAPALVADNCFGGGGGGSGGGGATFTGCNGTTNTISPALLQIRKNGLSTGTFEVTVGTATTVTASGPSNLIITPASQSISGMGSFSVRSINNSRGTFPVTFSSPCFTRIVQVRVNP